MGWILIQTAIIGGIYYWADNHAWPEPGGKPSGMAIALVAVGCAYAVTLISGLVTDGARSAFRHLWPRIERE